jgi:eukaryotic-like serine/threonine-protein kinase
MSSEQRRLYEFGPFLLDPGQRRLSKDRTLIQVAPKGMDILIFLVEHKGEVVTKDDLIQSVWPNTFVEEANLSQNVFLLRKALGEKAQENRYIATVPGRGYRFVASVRETAETDAGKKEVAAKELAADAPMGTVPAVQASASVVPALPQKMASWRRSVVTWGVVIAAVLTAAVLAERRHWLGGSAKAAGVSSIAVLPLENLT